MYTSSNNPMELTEEGSFRADNERITRWLEADEAMGAPIDFPPCLQCMTSNTGSPLLAHPLPQIDDEEGEHVPASLPTVIDAHIHLFPDRIFEALWRWFQEYGWPIRYPLHSPGVVDFLSQRGVSHMVALHYAHKPGLAPLMNQYMASLCQQFPQITGVATVYPGEEGAQDILTQGFAMGLKGVKLHCHVQCFSPDDPNLHEIYEACVAHDQPLVMHAGREPKSPGYACDPHELCRAERVEAVLRSFPKIRLCVPHLGVDEFSAYASLLERYDNLWLDTTMVLADYFTLKAPLDMLTQRPERILYGTDFPNIPYAWDRELRQICQLQLPKPVCQALLHKNATAFYDITPNTTAPR